MTLAKLAEQKRTLQAMEGKQKTLRCKIYDLIVEVPMRDFNGRNAGSIELSEAFQEYVQQESDIRFKRVDIGVLQDELMAENITRLIKLRPQMG